MLCVIAFGLGSVWGKFRFITANAYTLETAIPVQSRLGDGVIPKGTELYFHSSAHRQTVYWVYVSIPDELSQRVITESGFDDYGGIKRLTVKAEDQRPREVN
jgi:hypothetical protein